MKIIYNKLFIFTTIVLIVIGIAFYWFAYRPSRIRHDCSWVEGRKAATSEQPAITKQDADDSQVQYGKCNDKYPDHDFGGSMQDLLDSANVEVAIIKEFGVKRCKDLVKYERPIISAQPESVWYRPATDKEYNFCIRDKGL